MQASYQVKQNVVQLSLLPKQRKIIKLDRKPDVELEKCKKK
jgi:hypothetical protein